MSNGARPSGVCAVRWNRTRLRHRLLSNGRSSVLLHRTDTGSTYETRRSEPSPSVQPTVREASSSASKGWPSSCTCTFRRPRRRFAGNPRRVPDAFSV
eukprot:1417690-Prymnesium_polylepis.1